MEEIIKTLTIAVVHACQFLAILVISIGIVKAMVIFLKGILPKADYTITFEKCRLHLGYSFSLGLSFLIGGSILKTALAPTWTDIGQLAAIIAIRTVLNYFLLKDIDTHPDIIARPVAERGSNRLKRWLRFDFSRREKEGGEKENKQDRNE